MSYLFSSESVSEGHPDKVSDQISDALVDQFLAYDDHAHCAIETFVTTGQVVIMGEVRSEAYIDLQTIARQTIKKIGYTKSEYQFDGDSCGILTAIHEQSDDINRGVDRGDDENQGAGDQGMMFGYAINETEKLHARFARCGPSHHAHAGRHPQGRSSQMTYLRPDAKSQVTVEYSDEGIPQRIDTIVVSTQHDEFDADEPMLRRIKDDVINILMPRVKAADTFREGAAPLRRRHQILRQPHG
jgi:S-adenosylmethionine synthetase